MSFYWLALGILAVWRITHLLNAEDGPWDMFVRFRRLAGEGLWGSLLDCFCCLSVWIAAPLAYWLGENWKERLLLWPALSAGAILAERLTANGLEKEPPAAVYYEESEDHDVLLRQQESEPPGSKRTR
jgi:hypothetical protein